ncbi:MAG: redoxin domain-containing protein [Candidatus Methanomethylophilaceae archaeon]|nr:redoxin domain-containing protein [Candidatus Methanomethylophilaceae archaeon]
MDPEPSYKNVGIREENGFWFLPDGISSKDLVVGDRVPDFEASSTDGRFVLSERVAKGPVLLYFYVVNYGKTCINYMALMNERKQELDDLNVSLVHINPESLENHRAWIRYTSSLYEHISDTDQRISKAYGAIVERARTQKILGNTNREFFLITRDMRLRFVWRAYDPMDTLPMDELLDILRRGTDSD